MEFKMQEYVNFFVKGQCGSNKAFIEKDGKIKINSDLDFDIKESEASEKNIKKIISWAVNCGYKDTQRTCKGINKEEKENALQDIIEGIEKYLKLESNNSIYDIMGQWVNKMNNDCKNNTWGKAQKIVSMAFKYLYCIPSLRKKYKDQFSKCLMPLDSYTIAWIDDRAVCKESVKWSALDWEKIKKYQDNARTRSNNCEMEKLSMLEVDFIIWNISQIRKMGEEIKKFISNNLGYPGKDLISKDDKELVRMLEKWYEESKV